MSPQERASEGGEAMPENWRSRCDWCGWPLDPEEKMCRATDCSMRPRPTRIDTDLRQECRAAEALSADALAILSELVTFTTTTHNPIDDEHRQDIADHHADIVGRAKAVLAALSPRDPSSARVSADRDGGRRE